MAHGRDEDRHRGGSIWLSPHEADSNRGFVVPCGVCPSALVVGSALMSHVHVKPPTSVAAPVTPVEIPRASACCVCVCVGVCAERVTLAGEDGVEDNYEYNYPCRCSALYVFYEKVCASHPPPPAASDAEVATC